MEDEYKEKFMVAETTKAGLDGKKNCISFGEPYVNVNIFGHHCYLAISSYEKPDFPLWTAAIVNGCGNAVHGSVGTRFECWVAPMYVQTPTD